MTWAPFPPKRTPTRRGGGLVGGLLVGAGWSLLVLAVAVLFTQTNGSPLPAVLGVAGAVCASGGVLVLSRAGWVLFGLFAAAACGVGLYWAADAREVAAQGRPMACEVMAVRQDSRPGLRDGRGQAEPETFYVQTMRCPVGTFTLERGSHRDPVGAKVEMVYPPGGPPRWVGVEDGNLRFGMVATSIGALLTLVLSLLGWRAARRRTMAEQKRRQATVHAPPAPPTSSPYKQW
jgi:preprotein translocase subunit SecG